MRPAAGAVRPGHRLTLFEMARFSVALGVSGENVDLTRSTFGQPSSRLRPESARQGTSGLVLSGTVSVPAGRRARRATD
jgi:hypothetical protein